MNACEDSVGVLAGAASARVCGHVTGTVPVGLMKRYH